MKTTLNLEMRLLIKAIDRAVRERTSLAQLIGEGLRLRLASVRRDHTAVGFARLAIYQGRGGLAANVDPLSNRSLFAAAETEGSGAKHPLTSNL